MYAKNVIVEKMCVCMYVCVCVCIYIYIFIYQIFTTNVIYIYTHYILHIFYIHIIYTPVYKSIKMCVCIHTHT